MQNLRGINLSNYFLICRDWIAEFSPCWFCIPPLIRPALRRATFPQGKAFFRQPPIYRSRSFIEKHTNPLRANAAAARLRWVIQ